MNLYAPRKFVVAALLLISASVNAAWELDNAASAMRFVSIKNNAVGEVHQFRELSGSVDDAGKVTLTIALTSVDTQIEIRDTRMKELLFEVASFPTANLSAMVELDAVSALGAGETRRDTLTFSLDLHGHSAEYQAEVSVSRRADGAVVVATAVPVMLNAADFELAPGIEALQAVAKLMAISTVVPVTATLVFVEP